MKKLFLLLTALFFFGVVLPSNAQIKNYEDVIYLKNGSVIKGIIVEQVPNESIKIETRDGNIFVYKIEEIQKITKEQNTSYRQIRSRSLNPNSMFNKPSGYMGLIEVGGGLGVGEWAATRLSLNIINGYRFIPQFAVGLGVGVEVFMYEVPDWDYSKETDITLPIFLHLRSDFIEGKVSPYIAFNVGYNVNLSGNFFDGIMLEPTLGISFNVGQKNRITTGISFMMNRVKYAYYSSNYYEEDKAMGNALKLKVGFSF